MAATEFQEYLVDLRPSSPGGAQLAGAGRTKLGGLPDWIQGDGTPACAACGEEEMSFVAQIDSIGGDYMFGDAGMLYLFYCPECHAATAFEQCY